MLAPGRDEYHVGTALQQQADQIDLAQRPGIAIGLRYFLVQDQHLAPTRSSSAGDGTAPTAGWRANSVAQRAAKMAWLRTW